MIRKIYVKITVKLSEKKQKKLEKLAEKMLKFCRKNEVAKLFVKFMSSSCDSVRPCETPGEGHGKRPGDSVHVVLMDMKNNDLSNFFIWR